MGGSRTTTFQPSTRAMQSWMLLVAAAAVPCCSAFAPLLAPPQIRVANIEPCHALRRAGDVRACAAEESEDQEAEPEEAVLYKKKKGAYKPYQPKDNRDKLLYQVTEITPPPKRLGAFRLGPSAGCGDLISARVRLDGEAEKVEQV